MRCIRALVQGEWPGKDGNAGAAGILMKPARAGCVSTRHSKIWGGALILMHWVMLILWLSLQRHQCSLTLMDQRITEAGKDLQDH